MNHLRIITFNCRSFNSNREIIELLLDQCDLLLLQETLITDCNCSNLENVNSDFSSFYTPATRSSPTGVGRSSGGLAVFYRKSNISFTPIYISSRAMGLKLLAGNCQYLILNVYSPCDYGSIDSLIEYKSNMAQLSNVCLDEMYDVMLMLGDFNCDPSRGRFFKEFHALANECSLHMADINSLPSDT